MSQLLLLLYNSKNQPHKHTGCCSIPNQIGLKGMAADIHEIWEKAFKKVYEGGYEKDKDLFKELQYVDEICQSLSLKRLNSHKYQL